MAAVVDICEHNSATPDTRTIKTSGTVRFKQTDDANVDNVNPMVKPATTQRSMEKWLRLRIGATGPTGSLTNPKFYTSGSLGTGATAYVRTTNPGTYTTPSIPANNSAGTDATTFVTGARKAIDVANAGPYTGTSTNIADFVVLWIEIASTITAPQNPTTTLSLFFAYDET